MSAPDFRDLSRRLLEALTVLGGAKDLQPGADGESLWEATAAPLIREATEALKTPLDIKDLARQMALLALSDALAPFARYAEVLPPIIEGTPRLTDDGPALAAQPNDQTRVITFGDLRRARAVLSNVRAPRNGEEAIAAFDKWWAEAKDPKKVEAFMASERTFEARPGQPGCPKGGACGGTGWVPCGVHQACGKPANCLDPDPCPACKPKETP